MNIYLLVLRLVHVFAGVIWGGGTILLEVFIGRSVMGTGETGQKFMEYLMGKLQLDKFMTVMAVSTVLAGVLLYWHDSDGLASAWKFSNAGLGFGIGAIFGLVAFFSGMIFGRSNAELGQIGSQIQGQPSDEQMMQIQTLQKRIKTVSPIHLYSMILALMFMATARYFIF